MLATRWEPWTEMNRLGRELDRIFARADRDPSSLPGIAFPAFNAWHDEDHFYIEAELPGFSIGDIEILVTGDQLTLKGERRPPEIEGGKLMRQECRYGKFSRTMKLAAEVDGGAVSATLRNGVLSVTLPKREVAKPRRVEVKPA